MKAPARQHTDLVTLDGNSKIGEITSGTFGIPHKYVMPRLQSNVSS